MSNYDGKNVEAVGNRKTVTGDKKLKQPLSSDKTPGKPETVANKSASKPAGKSASKSADKGKDKGCC